ncbi:hypothetical protein C480_22259 [Natrialba aegyptia DSM 13077]|uniref:Uncharacterized protein n=1 Tax=Natrialba aegyptia DSM 13077 TaxID=1227491 RepID=M0AH59_9EURY|nr:hypothetical protein C480_22259 [Natrialba aegyptia DSM 13077]
MERKKRWCSGSKLPALLLDSGVCKPRSPADITRIGSDCNVGLRIDHVGEKRRLRVAVLITTDHKNRVDVLLNGVDQLRCSCVHYTWFPVQRSVLVRPDEISRAGLFRLLPPSTSLVSLPEFSEFPLAEY